MKDKVYPSPEVAPFHDKFVWAHLNVDLAETRKVMPQFQIRGVPYIAIISKHGEVLGTNTGLIKTPQFVELVTRALEKNGPIVTPQTRPATTPAVAQSPPPTQPSANRPRQRKGPFANLFKRKNGQ